MSRLKGFKRNSTTLDYTILFFLDLTSSAPHWLRWSSRIPSDDLPDLVELLEDLAEVELLEDLWDLDDLDLADLELDV